MVPLRRRCDSLVAAILRKELKLSSMRARDLARQLQKRPLLGLFAVTVGFLGQWFRHTIFPFSEGILGEAQYVGLIVMGAIGVVLIWKGLGESEIPATWKGYVGGLLIWVGWFETGFHVFADIFNVPPYQATPRLISPPDLNLIQASFAIFIPLFILYGLFNRETKCNFMRWIHRNLRINPGKPTPDLNRNFARIVALETIFVIWFCYAIWLYITYFGASMTIIMGAYVLWAAWFAYLFMKLLKVTQIGHALRYGVPVGIIGFVLVATPSHMRLFPAIWLKPFEYPMSSIMALIVFLLMIYVFMVPKARPESA